MENLFESVKELSRMEKILVGISLGGVLLNRIIPSEYVGLDVISLGISSLATMGLAIKAEYNSLVNYPTIEELEKY